MKTFEHVVMIGCGAIGKTALVYWNIIIPHITYSKFTIVEPLDLPFSLQHGMDHMKISLDPDNYRLILDGLDPDFVLDLSIGVDAISIINYCQERNILYLSTAMEDWHGFPDWDERRDLYRHSLLMRQRIALLNNDRPSKHHPTALIDHGMNPGLISHFAKIAIENMAREEGIDYSSHAEAAYKLGICVIQCSEIDTQISNIQEDPNVFYNTWSSMGFIEEGLDPVQLGWGTHEEEFPIETGVKGDEEQRFLPIRGMDLKVRGYNPIVGDYVGFCIPHGESASLPRYLTYEYGGITHRPSSYYVYSPSKIAENSINRLRERGYKAQDHYYVLKTDDIVSGQDAVGALLIRNDGRCYWAGTIIQKSDVLPELKSYLNPTCLQVGCGVLSGIDYVANHRNSGVVFPESVSSYRVFEVCGKFLGKIQVGYVDKKMSPKFQDLIVNV